MESSETQSPSLMDLSCDNGVGEADPSISSSQSWDQGANPVNLASVPHLSQPLPIEQLRQVSPNSLAYIGDAVYELFVRTACLLPPSSPQQYHQQVVSQVRAEYQAQQLRSLHPYLTDEEQSILKRGRNAAHRRPRRLDLDTYRQATALETLLGYLYLTNPTRLSEVLQHLSLDLDSPSASQ